MSRYAAKPTATVVRTSFGRTRRSGTSLGHLPARRRPRPEHEAPSSPTSCVRARSRRCGVSAARCRYGSTRPTASDQPASTALRSVRSGPTRTAAGDQELGDVHVERGLRGTERRGREVDQHRTFVRDEHVAQVEAAVGDARCVKPGDLLARDPRASRRAPDRGSRARAGRRPARRVTTSASPSGPSAAVTTSGTRTPACAAMRVARPSCSTCSSRPTGALRGGSR